MLQTAAAAGKRMGYPMYILPAGLLLCSLLLLLHSQLQVHGQLRAAHEELADIKSAVAKAAAHGHGTHGPFSHLQDSSSSSDAAACSHNNELMQQLVGLVQDQQMLLDALPKRHKQLSNKVQQLADRAKSLLSLAEASSSDAAAAAAGSSNAVASTTGVMHLPDSQQEFVGCSTSNSTNITTAAAAAAATLPGTLCLDMTELLGMNQYFAGITWEPKVRKGAAASGLCWGHSWEQ